MKYFLIIALVAAMFANPAHSGRFGGAFTALSATTHGQNGVARAIPPQKDENDFVLTEQFFNKLLADVNEILEGNPVIEKIIGDYSTRSFNYVYTVDADFVDWFESDPIYVARAQGENNCATDVQGGPMFRRLLELKKITYSYFTPSGELLFTTDGACHLNIT